MDDLDFLLEDADLDPEANNDEFRRLEELGLDFPFHIVNGE
jgi:hypothetical protein